VKTNKAEPDWPVLLAEAQEQERIASQAFADVKAELDQLWAIVIEHYAAEKEISDGGTITAKRLLNADKALRETWRKHNE